MAYHDAIFPSHYARRDLTTYRFPDGFLWAAATCACSIEGAPFADGASETIQRRFAATPRSLRNGQSEEVAADHYHRFREDVALMAEIGLKAYQFTVSWARVIPDGTGRVNEAGLAFYDRLVDELTRAGVAPVPILYCWDLPGVLQDRGGWANRDCADWFAEYAAVVFDRLGDRATHWLTIVEPWSIVHDHLTGGSAPGVRDIYSAARVLHHLMLGHGKAVQAFRAGDAIGEIGSPSSPVFAFEPATDAPADIAATERMRCFSMELFFDPFLRREYPPSIVALFGEAWPEVRDGDLETISQPVDFLGVTYYTGARVAAGSGGPSERTSMDWLLDPMGELLDVHLVVEPAPPPKGSWYHHPEGLANVLRWLRDRYDNPRVQITENGLTVADVEDARRVEFMRDHLVVAHRLIEEGVNLVGYHHFSLMDSWEFRRGFQPYGLIKIDYETLERTIRTSASWYRDVMADNGFD
jgi:beta-glucosidase